MNLLERKSYDAPEREIGIAASSSVFAGLARPASDDHEHSLIGSVRPTQLSLPVRRRRPFTRACDILLSLFLIVLFAPVMVLVALLVVATDPGPAFYVHRRVGLNGASFGCIKFRTMRVDADLVLESLFDSSPELRAAWARTHKLEDDPRVTRLGKCLRISSLDELPQLFNVLRGEMSLVGPRPVTAGELVLYGRYSAHYLSVRPGLTGLWQVKGRSATTYRRRVAADVTYVRRRCVVLDAYIVLATVPAVIFAKGSI